MQIALVADVSVSHQQSGLMPDLTQLQQLEDIVVDHNQIGGTLTLPSHAPYLKVM